MYQKCWNGHIRMGKESSLKARHQNDDAEAPGAMTMSVIAFFANYSLLLLGGTSK
jgi:hypothetical protein